MISFQTEDGKLLLNYESEGWNNAKWLDAKLEQEGEVTLRRTFTFRKDGLFNQPEDEDDSQRTFVMGTVDGRYIRINKSVLGLQHDLLIDSAIRLDAKLFVAHRDISVFRKIDELTNEPIVIGGDHESAIPEVEFKRLLNEFPTSTELTHYARARIHRILNGYLDMATDAEQKFDAYLSRRKPDRRTTNPPLIQEYELHKFQYVRDELRQMLKESDAYPEKEWQRKIVQFLLLLFPKYIAVLENVHIKDFYASAKEKNRYIDLMLVDADGNVDIVEIKKPFTSALVSHTKYRGNHTPRNELAGTVMQAEKYLFHLSKWGRAGERAIFQKRKNELPPGIALKISNPKAMILLGRDDKFTQQQRFDFEIIRRKYANVIDIMSYDDLLRRLDNIIAMLRKNSSIGQSLESGDE